MAARQKKDRGKDVVDQRNAESIPLIAIYSRKSKWTGKGESVENQIAMCREYIKAFIDGGEDAEIIEYEDEGFSGKNTKRPHFQQMMTDIRTRHFSYLVCYKLDRLGRNLADLVNLMEDLEKWGTSFVSIKEKFDTTTPIGKAMLFFSGILAQMEREQIAERVKDNMVMLARSGRWLGGNTPLGFSSQKLEKESHSTKKKSLFCLVQNEKEIGLVRFMFTYFMEKRSLTKVYEYLLSNDIHTRGGNEFSISGIRDILTNPVYCMADSIAYRYYYDLGCQVCIDEEELDGRSGLMGYAKTTSAKYKNQNNDYSIWIIAKGRHAGIIPGEEFVRVQKLLENNREKGSDFKRARNNVSLLSGLLTCTCGHLMRPKNYPASRVNERGERTFAYLCTYKDKTHGKNCSVKNVHGNTLDEAVCARILEIAKPDAGLIPLLEELKKKILDSDMEMMSDRQLLMQEYEKKKEEIKKLVDSVKKLGEESVSASYIDEEIRRLDTECRKLQEKIRNEKEDVTGSAELYGQVKEMVKKLKDFPVFFSELPLLEKRDFLKEVVEKVVWDGDVAHIYLNCPVPDKHRAVLRRFQAIMKPWLETKYPEFYHRITAAAGTYNRQKFALFYRKREIFQCPCFSVQCMIRERKPVYFDKIRFHPCIPSISLTGVKQPGRNYNIMI